MPRQSESGLPVVDGFMPSAEKPVEGNLLLTMSRVNLLTELMERFEDERLQILARYFHTQLEEFMRQTYGVDPENYTVTVSPTNNLDGAYVIQVSISVPVKEELQKLLTTLNGRLDASSSQSGLIKLLSKLLKNIADFDDETTHLIVRIGSVNAGKLVEFTVKQYFRIDNRPH